MDCDFSKINLFWKQCIILIVKCFFLSHPFPFRKHILWSTNLDFTSWIFWRQILRWSLGCKIFKKKQHLWREGCWLRIWRDKEWNCIYRFDKSWARPMGSSGLKTTCQGAHTELTLPVLYTPCLKSPRKLAAQEGCGFGKLVFCSKDKVLKGTDSWSLSIEWLSRIGSKYFLKGASGPHISVSTTSWILAMTLSLLYFLKLCNLKCLTFY